MWARRALNSPKRRFTARAVVFLLLDAWPASAKLKDQFAELPLHTAAAKHARAAVIARVIAAYPAAAAEADAWGSLPLHVGVVNRLPLRQLRHLVAANPAAAAEADEDGRTPVHHELAAMRGVGGRGRGSDDAIARLRTLVEAAPRVFEVLYEGSITSFFLIPFSLIWRIPTGTENGSAE